MRSEVVELWTAADWNKYLVSAVFSGVESPVTYLDAHPTGLTELLEWPSTEDMGSRAAALLVEAHQPLIAGASGSAVSGALQACRDRVWSMRDTREPPFFSFLWTTCLVAWGHPDGDDGNFESRWRRLFDVQGGGVQPVTGQDDVATGSRLLQRDVRRVEIRDLWELTARWLRGAPGYRDLVLPEPPPGHERHVGTSYALSQPDLRDRRWLARAVTDLDIAGYDPPPGPVLRGLVARARESAVSDEFTQQLERLVDMHRSGGRLYEDPVWAAIRRECLDPVTTAGGVVPLSAFTAVLNEYIDRSVGQLVWQGDDEPTPAPGPTSWRYDPRSEEHLLQGEATDGQFWSFLERPWEWPRTGLARLVREGLVCFARDARARLGVVTGAEVANAEISVARDDLIPQLRDWAGGSAEETPASGWTLVRGAELRAVAEELLPEGLDGVRQLIRTSAPPTARWVGGVRVGRGAYYRHPQLLPAISAPEATAVIDETTGTRLVEVDGRWSFDPSAPPVALHVRVVWPETNGWPDTVLRARFEDSAVHSPRAFLSADHVLVGPEDPPICRDEVGLQARGGPVVRLRDASATARRAGAVVGAVDAAPPDAVLTHHGHPDRLLFSILHNPEPVVTSRAPDASSRRRWRLDVQAVAGGRNIAVHDGALIQRDHPALVTLRHAVMDHELPTVKLDEPNAAVLLDQLQRAYSDSPVYRTAEELLAITCIDLGRRRVTRRDYLDTITQLTTARDRITTSKLFSLLRANAEAGRFELVRHQARPAVILVGVRPRMRWALVSPLPPPRKGVFEGALVGLVESTTAQAIANELATLADTRWLTATALPRESGPTDRLVAPVLKVLTDDPKQVHEVARRHLGGRLDAPGVLPGVPDIAPFAPAHEARRPGGFEVVDSYLMTHDEPRHIPGRLDTDGVVIERLVASTRSDVYAVVAESEVVYTSHSRDWAAVRAAELAATPLFGRCRHGILRSRSPLFPRLPMPIGRALLTHGLGLESSTYDGTGRLASVTYPFGRGAPALDRLPKGWIDPEECKCMIL